MNKKESMQGITSKMPLDQENKFAIKNLERQVKELAKQVRILTVLCDHYNKYNGLKVERFVEGITIGSSYYRVLYVDDLKDEKGKRLFGRIWQDKKIIEINKGCSYETQLQALLHENLHGICWEYVIDDDEDLVEPMSNGFYAFIINNSEFIREILRYAKVKK